MGKTINWIKNNKLTTLLLVIVGYLLLQSGALDEIFYRTRYSSSVVGTENIGNKADYLSVPTGALSQKNLLYPPPSREAAPSESQDRIVIKDTSLSLVVKNVEETISDILKSAEDLGGFLVSSAISKPEGSASGSIVVRVPAEKLISALSSIKGFAARVVNENVKGKDVTDEYEDLDAKLTTLEKTKAKFEEIMDSAVEIEDILQVQRELVSLQSQIDSVKGQQQYLTQSAKLSKITVYVSTDELALPYTPDQPWRPKVVFKLAVRSFISTSQSLGSAIIWVVVYSPIWIPAILIFKFIRKRKSS